MSIVNSYSKAIQAAVSNGELESIKKSLMQDNSNGKINPQSLSTLFKEIKTQGQKMKTNSISSMTSSLSLSDDIIPELSSYNKSNKPKITVNESQLPAVTTEAIIKFPGNSGSASVSNESVVSNTNWMDACPKTAFMPDYKSPVVKSTAPNLTFHEEQEAVMIKFYSDITKPVGKEFLVWMNDHPESAKIVEQNRTKQMNDPFKMNQALKAEQKDNLLNELHFGFSAATNSTAHGPVFTLPAPSTPRSPTSDTTHQINSNLKDTILISSMIGDQNKESLLQAQAEVEQELAWLHKQFLLVVNMFYPTIFSKLPDERDLLERFRVWYLLCSKLDIKAVKLLKEKDKSNKYGVFMMELFLAIPSPDFYPKYDAVDKLYQMFK